MNDRAKSIAKKLRRLAKYEIPSHAFNSRVVSEILTEIADELDPPTITAAYNCHDYIPFDGIAMPKQKPLLADAQAGWICKRRDGEYIRIKAIRDCHEYPVIGSDELTRTLDGKSYKDYVSSDDIVFVEPLAPEGSAEWAWQMMRLGKIVSRLDAPHEQYIYEDECIVAYGCHRSTPDWYLKYAEPTGWQLYKDPQSDIKAQKEKS